LSQEAVNPTEDDLAVRPAGLTEWEYFVLRHQTPGNLALHAVSWIASNATAVAFVVTRNWWWLAAFAVTPAIGVAGHYIDRDGLVRSRDFVRPQTHFYVGRILLLWFTGRYRTVSRAVIQKATDLGHEQVIHPSVRVAGSSKQIGESTESP
jgi:hypothetical protein